MSCDAIMQKKKKKEKKKKNQITWFWE